MPDFFTLLFNFFSKHIFLDAFADVPYEKICLFEFVIIDHLSGQLFYDVLMTHLVPGSKHLQFIGRHKFIAPY